MSKFIISRGDVFWIESVRNEKGAEIKKTRPGVIVSNNITNECSPLVSVVFMTTAPKGEHPAHVVTEGTDLGKCVGSTILCEQINSVSKERIHMLEGYMGRLPDEEMELIDEGLMEALGIEYGAHEGEYIEDQEEQTEDCMCKDMEYLKMERDLYKAKYDELMERIMAKANI